MIAGVSYILDEVLKIATLILALGALFFVVRLVMILTSGDFHDNIKGEKATLRASFDSAVSVSVRVLLVAIFPIATFLLGHFGIFALMGALALLSLLAFFNS